MEIITLILQIVILISLGLCVLFFRNYLPSYMNKKGENLATKEDVAEITKKTEEVQKEFKEQFELFSSDVQFKYDYQFRQYSELYCKLYAIIAQSEYVRHFVNKNDGKIIPFDDAPFMEIGPTKKQTETIRFENGKTSVESKVDVIETDISQFNKKTMADYIIANGELASQELLKLAVSYRFAYEYYSGNKTESRIDQLRQTADTEEFRIIRALVCCIVREYNSLRKSLKMAYDEKELQSGIPNC